MVLDSSSQVALSPFDNQWNNEKDVVKRFIANTEFGLNMNVEIAIVNFGDSAELASACGQLTTVIQLKEFLNNLPPKKGKTAINNALITARQAYKGCQRLNTLPVIILFTSGQEDIEQDLNYRFHTEELVKSEALLYISAVDSHINITDIQRMSKIVINNSEVFLYQIANSFTELIPPTSANIFSSVKVCESKLKFCVHFIVFRVQFKICFWERHLYSSFFI